MYILQGHPEQTEFFEQSRNQEKTSQDSYLGRLFSVKNNILLEFKYTKGFS